MLMEQRKEEPKHAVYWRQNLRVVGVLLAIWFVVSFGLGVVLVDRLNEVQFGNFPLGFWIAQQGAMYTFVVLIFVYVYLMNRLDRTYGVDEGHDGEACAGGDVS